MPVDGRRMVPEVWVHGHLVHSQTRGCTRDTKLGVCCDFADGSVASMNALHITGCRLLSASQVWTADIHKVRASHLAYCLLQGRLIGRISLFQALSADSAGSDGIWTRRSARTLRCQVYCPRYVCRSAHYIGSDRFVSCLFHDRIPVIYNSVSENTTRDTSTGFCCGRDDAVFAARDIRVFT